MPLIKKILKNDQREVILKWTGSGSEVLTLASLVSTGQTVTGIPAVHILAVGTSQSSTGVAAITRNAEVVLSMHGNFEFQTDGIVAAVLDENAGANITVDMTTIGTTILRLRKVGGYSESNQ